MAFWRKIPVLSARFRFLFLPLNQKRFSQSACPPCCITNAVPWTSSVSCTASLSAPADWGPTEVLLSPRSDVSPFWDSVPQPFRRGFSPNHVRLWILAVCGFWSPQEFSRWSAFSASNLIKEFLWCPWLYPCWWPWRSCRAAPWPLIVALSMKQVRSNPYLKFCRYSHRYPSKSAYPSKPPRQALRRPSPSLPWWP